MGSNTHIHTPLPCMCSTLSADPTPAHPPPTRSSGGGSAPPAKRLAPGLGKSPLAAGPGSGAAAGSTGPASGGGLNPATPSAMEEDDPIEGSGGWDRWSFEEEGACMCLAGAEGRDGVC